VSYNILAEVYATKHMYPYCESWNLSWPYRRNLLFKEFANIQADIFCLQEVQADHYEKDLLPFMRLMDFDGIYLQKSRESMGAYGKIDGCATFWNMRKFNLATSSAISFNDIARKYASDLGMAEGEMRKYVGTLSKDNVASICLLETVNGVGSGMQKNSSERLCVVNTHLYSNYLRPDIKLWQSLSLLREVEAFVSQRDCALLICGDFNSEPKSAVYDFIANGKLTSEHPELESEKMNVLPPHQAVCHGLELASVMSTLLGGSEPEFTNYTGNFRGVLDYMWFSPESLSVMHALSFPTGEELGSLCEGLPSPDFPSDHLMLCADLTLSPSGSRTNMHMGGNSHSSRDQLSSYESYNSFRPR
jgi:CCR4-NOT transcription complex subunit 6